MKKVLITGKNSFRIDFDFSSFEKKLDTLIATDPAESVMRKAAGAGAKILYDEMRARVPVKTGKLKESIYYWWDKQQSGKQSALYHGQHRSRFRNIPGRQSCGTGCSKSAAPYPKEQEAAAYTI